MYPIDEERDRLPDIAILTADEQPPIKNAVPAVGPGSGERERTAVATVDPGGDDGSCRCGASIEGDRVRELRGEEGDGGCRPDEGEDADSGDPFHLYHAPVAQSVPGSVM